METSLLAGGELYFDYTRHQRPLLSKQNFFVPASTVTRDIGLNGLIRRTGEFVSNSKIQTCNMNCLQEKHRAFCQDEAEIAFASRNWVMDSRLDGMRRAITFKQRINTTNPETKRIFHHFNRVENYTQTIQDEFRRFLISSFMMFCPDTPLCYDQGYFYRNYSYLSLIGKQDLCSECKLVARCQTCSCEPDCERKKDCCISKYVSMDPAEPIKDFTDQKDELSCLSTKLGSVYDSSGKEIKMPVGSYWMINKCPENYPRNMVWRKCKRFLHSGEQMQEIYHTPVFSSKTRDSYQNVFCAECFGERPDELYPWKKVYVSNVVDEEERIKENPSVKGNAVVFTPPKFLENKLRCIKPDISKCNVTGLWLKYDELLQWACETLPQTVIFSSEKRFKNVYCAMCNTFAPKFTLPVHELTTFDSIIFGTLDLDRLRQTLGLFSSLLSFSALEMLSAYQVDERCSKEEIFSPLLKRCLPIECDKFYTQKGPKCQRRIASDLSVSFLASFAVCNTQPGVNVFTYQLRKEMINLVLQMDQQSRTVNVNYALPIVTSTNRICVPGLILVRPKKAENIISVSNYMIQYVKNLTRRGLNGSLLEIKIGGFDTYFLLKTYVIENLIEPEQGDQTPTVYSYAAQWQHCPKIYLPKGYRLNYSDFEICILNYDVCFESFRAEISKERGVAICLDLYKEITDNFTRLSSDEDSPETYFSVLCMSVSSFGCLLTVSVNLGTQQVLTLPTKINIILSFSLFMANTFYTTSRFFIYYFPLCMLFGILSHFLWLNVLCWMSVSCLDVFNTMSNVMKLNSNRKQTKKLMIYLTACMTISMVIVAIHIQVSYQVSGGSSLGYSTITCFIADGALKIFTMVLPVALMVFVNFILFVAMTCCIKKNMAASNSQTSKLFKIYIKLSTVTGITWVFGLLYEVVDDPFLSHTHTLLNGSLGMLIFMAFGSQKICSKVQFKEKSSSQSTARTSKN
ncbi:uncharacterized protein LOC134262455 [Saccostrea cucullata]|uniref:uncharacterized protein LOC134262455 n=1 Tax=Saccostrea cuccullata TaxID=36930 RepID=UPI002ED1819A